MRPARAWFLEIVFVRTSVCMCACLCACVRVCVRPPGYSREMNRITNQRSLTAFQFLYMTLAIDITDGRGLSNEVRRELLSS